jgi:hypothetical protein
MTGIDAFFEGRHTCPADRIEEAFAVLPQADIGLDDVFHRIDDLNGTESRPQYIADGRIFRA